MVVRIAIVGAGINGLASAIKILDKYKHAQVVIIAREFSPDTTGDGSAGLWYPYLIGGTPPDLVTFDTNSECHFQEQGHSNTYARDDSCAHIVSVGAAVVSGYNTDQIATKWACESYAFLHERWLEGGHGICLQPAYSLYRDESRWVEPLWGRYVFGYHKFTDEELEYYNQLFSAKYVAGHSFTTFTFAPPLLMGYLLRRYLRANGQVMRAEVTSLQDPVLHGFDVVVNCSGLGARRLVPDDAVFPYRGQVIRVKAPWVTHTVMDEDGGLYIIPNAETVVLGGTRQKDDYNTEVDEKDTAFILEGCQSRIPSLQSADIYKQWVGLRPGRSSVRLDADHRDGKLFIHNYGHGGCGLTLFWGCATNVVQLLDQHMGDRMKQNTKL